jgi:hypothetical protein
MILKIINFIEDKNTRDLYEGSILAFATYGFAFTLIKVIEYFFIKKKYTGSNSTINGQQTTESENESLSTSVVIINDESETEQTETETESEEESDNYIKDPTYVGNKVIRKRRIIDN